MSEFFFNIDHGYLEALIRGFKGGLLTASDYQNLVQCETLEGLFINLLLLHILVNFRILYTLFTC